MTPNDAEALLQRADKIKTADPSAFAADLQLLDAHEAQLSTRQQQYLRYLKGWRGAYEGDYERSIAMLESLAEASSDATLRFRAGATVVNVLSISAQYERAFLRLSQVLELLPQVPDEEAREQGLTVAAFLYNQVGQHDLGRGYAEQLIKRNRSGGSRCMGEQLRMEALYRTRKLQATDDAVRQAIDSCTRIGELAFANVIRTYVARLDIAELRFDAAIQLLTEHYDEVLRTQYPRLISEFDALLADAWYRKGDLVRAREAGLRAVDRAVKNQFTEPLILACRVLYAVSKRQGDSAAALAWHERYATADKGYLDDASARQLAFQRARHEATAKQLQIDGLNRQNQVLQLQEPDAVDRTAGDRSRLSRLLGLPHQALAAAFHEAVAT